MPGGRGLTVSVTRETSLSEVTALRPLFEEHDAWVVRLARRTELVEGRDFPRRSVAFEISFATMYLSAKRRHVFFTSIHITLLCHFHYIT